MDTIHLERLHGLGNQCEAPPNPRFPTPTPTPTGISNRTASKSAAQCTVRPPTSAYFRTKRETAAAWKRLSTALIGPLCSTLFNSHNVTAPPLEAMSANSLMQGSPAPIIDVHMHFFAADVLKPLGEFVAALPDEVEGAVQKLVRSHGPTPPK